MKQFIIVLLQIRTVHRHEFQKAEELLASAAELLARAKETSIGFEEIAGAGYVRDSEKEFAEASTLVAMVSGKKLPGPQQLNVNPASYLNGLGEAVGELRRYLLDGIRQRRFIAG